MFRYIKGRITGRFEGGIILENNGIGYEISMPLSSSAFLARQEDSVTVYTFLAVREDSLSLYGFDSHEELKMFMLLTTVSGIGNKAALSILSSLSVQEVKKAVLFDDQNAFIRAQGIGKKSASRIILELKDKLKDTAFEADPEAAAAGASESSADAYEDAVMALVSLGYTRAEASEAVSSVRSEDADAEDLLRAALRKISRI